jgi:hypothetical protein
MVNSNTDEGLGTLWDPETNVPVDLNIDDFHSRLQDWQQKARQAAGDPHFFGKYARNGTDYTHVWAMFGLVINQLAHGAVNGVQVKKAYTAHLPEDMNLITGLGKWAGPFYEQGILKLLDAYETEGAYYGRLPGEFAFMHNTLSQECIDEEREDNDGPTLMVPGNVHGFSDPSKTALARLSSITGWWDLQEIMEGRGNLKPCYLFHRIAETDTDILYEYRANEGTVIRTKVPKGVNTGEHKPRATLAENGWRASKLAARNSSSISCTRTLHISPSSKARS